MDVNYIGTVRVTKAFLHLIRRDKGRMIMVGSVSDRNPAGFGSAYVSSKAAVAWFTECLRTEMTRFASLWPLLSQASSLQGFSLAPLRTGSGKAQRKEES